jgi:hypothetical protein
LGEVRSVASANESSNRPTPDALKSVVYQGPTQGTIPHFDALGEQYKCPAYSNPPEHFTALVFEGSETPAGQAQTFAELFKKSKTGQDIAR